MGLDMYDLITNETEPIVTAYGYTPNYHLDREYNRTELATKEIILLGTDYNSTVRDQGGRLW